MYAHQIQIHYVYIYKLCTLAHMKIITDGMIMFVLCNLICVKINDSIYTWIYTTNTKQNI